ncbi:MAG: hypothetical protein P8J27_05585 [Mariniblastus sp.]|nr:hypothetical protein [Mariniblastus sp.]
MSTPEEQIEFLNEKLNELENESRRILQALNWSSKVRLILSVALLFFVLITGFLFYSLYVDIKTNRIAEVQRIINENPEEFSEPLTRQVMALAEEQGPFVVEAFRKQAQEDSELYLSAFDQERNTLISSMQNKLETKLADSYAAMLLEQEQMLREEFPVLKDPEKLAKIRANMEKVYDKIGKRYFVDSLRDEMENIADKLDTFPVSTPKVDNIPIVEQIASEMLELVRLMTINSDNYVEPPNETTTSKQVESSDGPANVDLDLKKEKGNSIKPINSVETNDLENPEKSDKPEATDEKDDSSGSAEDKK